MTPHPLADDARAAPAEPVVASAASLIRVHDVHRDYRMGDETVHALRGVTFDVASGEWAAVVGPSGCGKSTLLNLLGAVDRPTRGTVRIGEIAVLRAIGVSRRHVVEQIVVEGCALTVSGTLLGLALGLVTARYLNAILSDFPGLPGSFSFFVFRAQDAWIALGLLVAAGVLAGVYPSWRAASLPIAATLREEAVG